MNQVGKKDDCAGKPCRGCANILRKCTEAGGRPAADEFLAGGEYFGMDEAAQVAWV